MGKVFLIVKYFTVSVTVCQSTLSFSQGVNGKPERVLSNLDIVQVFPFLL